MITTQCKKRTGGGCSLSEIARTNMTPTELLHSLETCPLLTTSIAGAAAELDELRRDASLPRNLAVTIIFHCSPVTLAATGRTRLTVVRPEHR